MKYNILVIFIFFFNCVAIAEKEKEHIDFVIVENGTLRRNIDSLCYYDVSKKKYIKINDFRLGFGGIFIKKDDYTGLSVSDTILLYVGYYDKKYKENLSLCFRISKLDLIQGFAIDIKEQKKKLKLNFSLKKDKKRRRGILTRKGKMIVVTKYGCGSDLEAYIPYHSKTVRIW